VARLLCVVSHAQQGAQALGIAKFQPGQVHNHWPVVIIDDVRDVADCYFGGGDIQLAADIRDDLASGQNPVAQRNRRSLMLVV
jgi:hypothetical protein